MASAEFRPRLHNEVYPFIYPAKFRGSLKDKVAIVTGSVGAIGQAHAESFAVAGAKLFLVYNRTEPPPALKARCISLGASAVSFIKCDISELESIEAFVQQVLESAGRVDILVNNAATNGLGPFYKQDPRSFIRDMAINFNGPYALMRLLIPVFREQRSGCVVNIASRAGTVMIPYSTSYCASKAALINLTGCVQKEMDVEGLDDIHLYSLHPGGVKSTMVMKKYGEESVSGLPEKAQKWFGNLDGYDDSPHLSAMVSVALATGIAKEALKGKYFDVGQDLEDVIAQTAAVKANPCLYSLHTTFLGGLPNDHPDPESRRPEEPFEFPGF